MTEVEQIAKDLAAMHERIRKASTVTAPEVAACLRDAKDGLLSVIRFVEVAATSERYAAEDAALAKKEG